MQSADRRDKPRIPVILAYQHYHVMHVCCIKSCPWYDIICDISSRQKKGVASEKSYLGLLHTSGALLKSANLLDSMKILDNGNGSLKSVDEPSRIRFSLGVY